MVAGGEVEGRYDDAEAGGGLGAWEYDVDAVPIEGVLGGEVLWVGAGDVGVGVG